MPPAADLVVRFHAPLRRAAVADPRAPLPPLGPPTLAVRPSAPAELVPVARAGAAEAAVPDPQETEAARLAQMEAKAARRAQEQAAAVQQAVAALTAAARQFQDRQQRQVAEWQQAAVELAVTIAARLVHDRVVANDFAVETVVREAVALLGPAGPFTVRLHPADLALLESRLGGKTLFPDGAGMVVVTADRALARGSCRVDADDIEVTSRLGDQLATVREALLRSLGDARPGP